MAEPRIDEVIARYLELRDELAEARAAYQATEETLKMKMQRLSIWLRDRADELGVETFRTTSGTAYKSEKSYARVADWDKFKDYISKSDNWQIIEKRVSKRAALDLLKEEDIEPTDIGVEVAFDIEYLVRRPDKPRGK